MADLQPLLPRKISQSIFAPLAGDAPPPLPAPPPTMAGANPLGTIAPPPMSNVVNPDAQRVASLNADINRRENPVAPTTTLGKIGHVASRIGNALGDIFAPTAMALIPGTDLHSDLLLGRDKDDLNQISKLQTESADRAGTAATTAYTAQRPAIEQAKIDERVNKSEQQAIDAQNKVGRTLVTDENGTPQRDPEGHLQFRDDTNSANYQSRKIHDDTEQSRQELMAAQAEVDRTKNDPSSPAYKLALTRAEIARQNAGAAITRAQAYYGNYLQHAFNKDLSGNVLPGAPQVEDNNGNVTTVGSTNATQAVKAQGNAAQFNDVHGALDNLEQNARSLVTSGGKLNSPGVIYALQHSSGTPGQFIQSLEKGNLTPEERQYVQSVVAAHENVQALRKAAGGTATDSAVAKLDSLIPNGSTPDLDYLLGQTSQIRQTADRLGKGVTTVKGGLGVHGGHANGGSPGRGSSAGTVRKFNQATGRLE